jgi:epoxyqueuosine reductase
VTLCDAFFQFIVIQVDCPNSSNLLAIITGPKITEFLNIMKQKNSLIWRNLSKRLDDNGLNVFSSIPISTIDDDLRADLDSAMVDRETSYNTVVIIGHSGSKIWPRVEADLAVCDEPVDQFSIKTVNEAFSELAKNSTCEIIYPGSTQIPLQKLGKFCGWGESSWLGINIYKPFGTWYAFRAVLLSTLELPQVAMEQYKSPCLSCVDKPCLTACPVNAPGEPGEFDLNGCVNYRLSSNSDCANTCLARYACPEAKDFAYPQSMGNYFYGRSLQTLKRWEKSGR